MIKNLQFTFSLLRLHSEEHIACFCACVQCDRENDGILMQKAFHVRGNLECLVCPPAFPALNGISSFSVFYYFSFFPPLPAFTDPHTTCSLVSRNAQVEFSFSNSLA